MEQHEKELLEKLRQQTENIEIPESLMPDRIEEKLKIKKYRRRRNIYMSALAAAGCAAIFGAAVLYGGMRMKQMEQEKERQNKASVEREAGRSEGIRTAKSYGEIYRYMKLDEPQQDGSGFLYGIFERAGGGRRNDTASYETENAKMGMLESVTSDYSRTNTREADVDEADIVKTDGRYIYSVTDEMNEIGIVDTAAEKMEKVSDLVLEDCEYIQEIYVQDNRLIVLYQEAYRPIGSGDEKSYWSTDTMMTAVYDISNPAAPERMNDFTQSGAYHTSRMYGDYLYVFSQHYIYDSCDKDQYGLYIPCVEKKLIPADRIFLPETEYASQYIVVTSINVKNPDEIIDTMAVLSGAGECYVSPENIYICDRLYKGETTTSIRKISYKDGKMKGNATAEVLGYLHDSFSIDEYKGYLRMVVTLERADTNSVYVLDKDLKMTGKIEGLAKDERVYSARFMGDIGYFVTFRETDPLFSADLSDPSDPRIIGRLKIPGFSEYLHPYGDGLLLGIGREVDEKEGNRVKLSMFDISNPNHVKEVDKSILEGVYDSPAFHSYKSVTVSAERNIIGFSAYAEREKYYLYEYQKGRGFICNMKEGIPNGWPEARGIYIGDVFYLVKGGIIESYSLKDYSKIDDIIL